MRLECSDGGKCHHACIEMCWRKASGCLPLSDSGLDDNWEHKPETLVTRLREEARDNPNSLLYKAADQIENLAWSLVMVMDGTEDHDIQAETGLCDEDCDRIASTRKLARAITSK